MPANPMSDRNNGPTYLTSHITYNATLPVTTKIHFLWYFSNLSANPHFRIVDFMSKNKSNQLLQKLQLKPSINLLVILHCQRNWAAQPDRRTIVLAELHISPAIIRTVAILDCGCHRWWCCTWCSLLPHSPGKPVNNNGDSAAAGSAAQQ